MKKCFLITAIAISQPTMSIYTKQTKLKILAVAGEQQSITTTKTTRKVVVTVAAIPGENPFGHNKDGSAPFEVEVYNHNIENWSIGPTLVDEVAYAELMISPFKKDANTATTFRFIVNDLSFRI